MVMVMMVVVVAPASAPAVSGGEADTCHDSPLMSGSRHGSTFMPTNATLTLK